MHKLNFSPNGGAMFHGRSRQFQTYLDTFPADDPRRRTIVQNEREFAAANAERLEFEERIHREDMTTCLTFYPV